MVDGANSDILKGFTLAVLVAHVLISIVFTSLLNVHAAFKSSIQIDTQLHI